MQGSDHPSGHSRHSPDFPPPFPADFRRFPPFFWLNARLRSSLRPNLPLSRHFRRFPPIVDFENRSFSHDFRLLYSEVPAETILAEIQAKCQHSRLWQKSRPKVGQKSRFWLLGTTRHETDFSRFVVLRFFSSQFCTSSLQGFGGSQTSPKSLYLGSCASSV